jgi:hypothetical protein
MTNGNSFDHRSDDQLETDRTSVQRQVKALTQDEGSRRAEEILRRLAARQEAAPKKYALPFDRITVDDSPNREGFVLVARGELVVRNAPAPDRPRGLLRFLRRGPVPATDRLMRKRGYLPVKGTDDAVAERTTVYRSDAKKPEELLDDVRWLNRRGVESNVNLLAPLGWIIKGDDFPTATTGPGAYPPPNALGPAAATDVRVAVIDTGIVKTDRGDDWLDAVRRDADNIDPLDVLPDNGNGQGDGRLDWSAAHGHFAAGVVQQVAPDCEIVAYRFTRSDGLGTDKDAADAMRKAADDAHRDGKRLIINASLGAHAVNGVEPVGLKDAVDYITATYPDTLIVASAGNDGTTEEMYPAAFDEVVAVGALTWDLKPATFSSRGAWVDCSAIGVGVVSTFAEGKLPPEEGLGVPDVLFGVDAWAVWTGTSFSAPQISGEIARRCQQTPGLLPRAALTALLQENKTKEPGFGNVIKLLAGTPA